MKLISFAGTRRFSSIGELIQDCAQSGDIAAWEEFISRIHPLVAVTVTRTAQRYGGAPDSILEELIQDTYVKLCANDCKVLQTFRAETQEAIFGLIKSIAANVVHDHLRAANTIKRGSGHAEGSIEEADAAGKQTSGAELSPVEKQVLIQQVDDYLSQLNIRPVERQVFWLYYRHGMTTKAISEIPNLGLTQKGVESVIHRLTARVREWIVEGSSAADSDIARGKAFGIPF
jgi:RNA polymerase sigma-70 factor (ECF subfamily)